MALWHSNFATEDRLPLFAGGLADRRRALVRLARLSGEELVLFCIVDDHVHLATSGSRATAGRFVQRLRLAWRSMLHPSVRPAYYRPVADRSHLLRLVSYMIRQPQIHGLAEHPALWEGSCFADLVGARVLAGLRLGVFRLLPRLSVGEITRFAGLDSLQPLRREQLAALEPAALVAAARAALGVNELARKSRGARLARRAIVTLAQIAGIGLHQLAPATDCSVRVLRSSTALPPDRVLRSVRLRLAIEQAVERSHDRFAPGGEPLAINR